MTDNRDDLKTNIVNVYDRADTLRRRRLRKKVGGINGKGEMDVTK